MLKADFLVFEKNLIACPARVLDSVKFEESIERKGELGREDGIFDSCPRTSMKYSCAS